MIGSLDVANIQHNAHGTEAPARAAASAQHCNANHVCLVCVLVYHFSARSAGQCERDAVSSGPVSSLVITTPQHSTWQAIKPSAVGLVPVPVLVPVPEDRHQRNGRSASTNLARNSRHTHEDAVCLRLMKHAVRVCVGVCGCGCVAMRPPQNGRRLGKTVPASRHR